jgi:hypothetical protein
LIVAALSPGRMPARKSSIPARLGDRCRSGRVVAGQHHHPDTHRLEARHGSARGLAQRIGDGQQRQRDGRIELSASPATSPAGRFHEHDDGLAGALQPCRSVRPARPG